MVKKKKNLIKELNFFQEIQIFGSYRGVRYFYVIRLLMVI